MGMKRAVGRKKTRKLLSKNPSRRTASSSSFPLLRDICLILLAGLSAYFMVSFFTPLGGVMGKASTSILTQWFGASAYFVILLPLMVIIFLQDPGRKPNWLHLGYLAAWFLSVSLFFDLMNMGGTSAFLSWPLIHFLGKGGTAVFAWTFLVIATVLILNVSLKSIFAAIHRWIVLPVAKLFEWGGDGIGMLWKGIALLFAGIAAAFRYLGVFLRYVAARLPRKRAAVMPVPDASAPAPIGETIMIGSTAEEAAAHQEEEQADSAQHDETPVVEEAAAEEVPDEAAESVAENATIEAPAEAPPLAGQTSSVEEQDAQAVTATAETQAATAAPPAAANAAADLVAVTLPDGKHEQLTMVKLPDKIVNRGTKEHKGYKLPGLKMLDEAEPRKGKAAARIEPENYSRLLEETLRSFGIESTVVHVERGPSVTRYELQPAKGVKVARITALQDDIALALAATSLRIEAPIPGKSAIGIEIPNSLVEMVYFRDLLATPLYKESPMKTILALGRDIAGKPAFTELRRMPHLLIAGATGSGKTVCMNTLIASILFKATPHEVQFVMIDPKRVELTIYDGIPHLIRDVVTDAKEAAKVLVDVLGIMDERYFMFKEARVRNLEEYNKARREAPLPYIVVLIDELADLMTLAAASVETSIARLTALARAAGIHLVVATQRPSVDVITGVIKANIPSRIAFAVSSLVDSRTILDIGGAEKLLGRGDMLFKPIDAMKSLRLQGAYIGLGETEALVNYWCRQPKPENLVQLPNIADAQIEEEASQHDGDELYGEAKDVILRTGQASVSTLQRKLKIGYARAGRLMDLMEQRGVVGPADGAKPRKILVPNPFKSAI